MSSKKEEKAQAAAERIKALTTAKGLSRAQAERVAASASRNVNAYGQKEEGPSRWQEKREAKRQMYLMSTEKAVKLGERKDRKANVSTVSSAAPQCQKCFDPGHWTYECTNARVYISRPSRTQQLKNPKLKMKVSISYDLDNPETEEEEKSEKKSKKSKRKHRQASAASGSGSDSEASVFGTDSGASSVTGSDYSSEESSSDDSSSSDSEEERRLRRKKKKQKMARRRRSYSSSSESSDTESDSESDSDDRRSRKKSKRHSKKR